MAQGISNIKAFALFGLLFVFSPFAKKTHAQGHEIGIIGGGTNFIGDVGDYGFHLPKDWFAGVFYRRNFNEHFSLRINAKYGNIRNDDALSNWEWRQHRNLSFHSPVTEFSAWIEFNFFPFDPRVQSSTPFIFWGLGLFSFDPHTMYDGNEVRLQPLGTEGQGSTLNPNAPYNLTEYIMPFGIGYKFSLSRVVNVGFEVGFRYTGTDYLDDVSGFYVNRNELAEQNGELAGILSDRSGDTGDKSEELRGNPTRNDWYIFTGFSISFKLYSTREKCTRF